ncbi:uncharacterized protein LY79DRAFT_532963 [Colletotrichum navitas]|uniref:Uncharacterized protein n=1 Tax=Colletotrichum navitas TaxID=681940 RepID=A0AAD8QD95_9PEZI|nr:uncharacterized protein LY79DRAFT_532963 [Colletotrichum navitas]KAK1600235.1 hypothetical protein LY79DRAFT_532963 [Colletotrichum navitas]
MRFDTELQCACCRGYTTNRAPSLGATGGQPLLRSSVSLSVTAAADGNWPAAVAQQQPGGRANRTLRAS